MKYLKLFEEFVGNKIKCDNCGWSWKLEEGGDNLYLCHKCFHDNTNVMEAKRPEWQDSDYPDAEGRFAELSPKDLAAWLIKTRKKDVKAISGALTQQVVFNRNEDPDYADKMEKTRKEVYKQLGRQDLLDKMDESLILEIGDASAKSFKWKANNNIKKEMEKLFDEAMKLNSQDHIEVTDGRFDYTFTNDDGMKYVVTFLGWMQKSSPTPNFTGKPLPVTTKYDSSFNVAFNTLKGSRSGEEINTNLGEHFRIMSTMTEIINHFMTEAENSGYPVKKLTIAPKSDDDGDATLDSKRGRLYMAFVIKQMKNLKTKSDYSVTKSYTGDHVSVVLGKWYGGNTIKTEE